MKIFAHHICVYSLRRSQKRIYRSAFFRRLLPPCGAWVRKGTVPTCPRVATTAGWAPPPPEPRQLRIIPKGELDTPISQTQLKASDEPCFVHSLGSHPYAWRSTRMDVFLCRQVSIEIIRCLTKSFQFSARNKCWLPLIFLPPSDSRP